MSGEFTVVIEKEEHGYFIGTVPRLQSCYTQAKSLDKLMERMKEAVLTTGRQLFRSTKVKPSVPGFPER